MLDRSNMRISEPVRRFGQFETIVKILRRSSLIRTNRWEELNPKLHDLTSYAGKRAKKSRSQIIERRRVRSPAPRCDEFPPACDRIATPRISDAVSVTFESP
jgi:hypothetical protein